MRILGIVTARAGSKRLPNKNRMELGGIPLWKIAVNEAIDSKLLKNIVITTDDGEILKEACHKSLRKLFFTVPRPFWLSLDHTPHLPVVQHAVEQVRLLYYGNYDAVMILHPTSPFRTFKHINEAIEEFKKCGYDSLVSVDKKDRRNAAIYIVSTERLFSKHCYIYPENMKCGRYVMDLKSSLDINTLEDFKVCEKLL